MAAAASSTGREIAQCGPATQTYVAPARPQGNQISITSYNIGAGQPESHTSSASYKPFLKKLTGDLAALVPVSHVICFQEVSAVWAVNITKLVPQGGMRPEGKLLCLWSAGRLAGLRRCIHALCVRDCGSIGLNLFVVSVILGELARHGPDIYVCDSTGRVEPTHRPIVLKHHRHDAM